MVQLTMVAMQNPPVAASSSPVSRVIELHPDTSMTNLEFLQQLEPKLAEFNRRLQGLTEDVYRTLSYSPDFRTGGNGCPEMSGSLFDNILDRVVSTITAETSTWPASIFPANGKDGIIKQLVSDLVYEMGSRFKPFLVGEKTPFTLGSDGKKKLTPEMKSVHQSAYVLAQGSIERFLRVLGFEGLTREQLNELGMQLEEDAARESVEVVVNILKTYKQIDNGLQVEDILDVLKSEENYQLVRLLMKRLVQIKYPSGQHEWQLDCLEKFIPENIKDFQAWKDKKEDPLDDLFSELAARLANLTWKSQQIFRAIIEGADWRVKVEKPVMDTEQDYSSRNGLILTTAKHIDGFIDSLLSQVSFKTSLAEEKLRLILKILATALDIHKDLSGLIFSEPVEHNVIFEVTMLINNDIVSKIRGQAAVENIDYWVEILEKALNKYAQEAKIDYATLRETLQQNKITILETLLHTGSNGAMPDEAINVLKVSLENILGRV